MTVLLKEHQKHDESLQSTYEAQKQTVGQHTLLAGGGAGEVGGGLGQLEAQGQRAQVVTQLGDEEVVQGAVAVVTGEGLGEGGREVLGTGDVVGAHRYSREDLEAVGGAREAVHQTRQVQL